MDKIIQWDERASLIVPYYPPGKRGRPPIEVEIMLRIYLRQCWLTLSDEGVKGAIYNSYVMRKFMGINFSGIWKYYKSRWIIFQWINEKFVETSSKDNGSYAQSSEGIVALLLCLLWMIDCQILYFVFATTPWMIYNDSNYIKVRRRPRLTFVN